MESLPLELLALMHLKKLPFYRPVVQYLLTVPMKCNLDFAFIPLSAYTMAKYGMSMCVLGMAEELKDDGIAVNALWPRTSKYCIKVSSMQYGNLL